MVITSLFGIDKEYILPIKIHFENDYYFIRLKLEFSNLTTESPNKVMYVCFFPFRFNYRIVNTVINLERREFMPHHHVIRYVILAMVVVAVAVYFVVRKKKK